METLIVERSSAGIVTVTLHRPEKKNAINGPMWDELMAVFREVAESASDRVLVLTGAGDAFCGGFLAGYRRTYDPLLAALHGNISASLVLEGHGPFYALEALPGLAQARLEALHQSVRRV